MDRFIPREKMGKKARKKLDTQKRVTWSFSPTTKRVESRKRYNRKNHERMEDDSVVFSFSLRGRTIKSIQKYYAWC
ncbi:MAG: hypothetical protein E7337_13380 [Clostridiales bacterium]|nr:hypothetical protein [Clostridiales bacterium]